MFDNVGNTPHLPPEEACGFTRTSAQLRNAVVDDMVNSVQFY